MAKRSILKLVTGSGDEPVEELIDEDENNMEEQDPQQEDWAQQEGQLTIDVYEDGDHIVIQSTIAGVDQDDLDVTITNDMVTIHGERKRDKEVNVEDYYYQELYWGSFSRSVILPHEVDTENAKASLKDGVLTVKLPKIIKSKTKKLKIS